MDPIPDNFSWSEIIRKPELLRDLLRFSQQTRFMDVITSGGVIKRIQYSPKSLNAVLDLRDIESTVGNIPLATEARLTGRGGIEYEAGDYYVHVFNSSDDFQILTPGPGDVLIVAGGGGGGYGGGGGGGRRKILQHTFSPPGTIPVVVGRGGAASTGDTGGSDSIGSNGEDSSVDGLVSVGGGGGGGRNAYGNGLDGGSGGGAGTITLAAVGGEGTAGQGYAGGDTFEPVSSGNMYYAGGGGAGGEGVTGGETYGGPGGPGASDDILGNSTYFAGGGGGSGGATGTGGLGGSGTGGTGASMGRDATVPAANRGGGGGGRSLDGSLPSAGADGIVVIRYPKSNRIGMTTSTTYPIPEDNPAETDCEACLNSIIVSATGDVVTSRNFGNVLQSRGE